MANLNVSKIDIDSIKELVKLMYMSPEDIIKKFPECHIETDSVDSFLIGYVRSGLLWSLYGDKMLSSEFRSDVLHAIAINQFN